MALALVISMGQPVGAQQLGTSASDDRATRLIQEIGVLEHRISIIESTQIGVIVLGVSIGLAGLLKGYYVRQGLAPDIFAERLKTLKPQLNSSRLNSADLALGSSTTYVVISAVYASQLKHHLEELRTKLVGAQAAHGALRSAN